MGMRLGEGSGAALAMPIVEAACAMYHRMGMLAASNIVLPKGKQEMGRQWPFRFRQRFCRRQKQKHP